MTLQAAVLKAQVGAAAHSESPKLLKTITSTGVGGCRHDQVVGMPATCPIGGATAASHGHSQADYPGPRR